MENYGCGIDCSILMCRLQPWGLQLVVDANCSLIMDNRELS